MTTNAITPNAAAVAAAQADASAASRVREENRKPAVAQLRESQNTSRYAERQAAKAEGRGHRLDREA